MLFSICKLSFVDIMFSTGYSVWWFNLLTKYNPFYKTNFNYNLFSHLKRNIIDKRDQTNQTSYVAKELNEHFKLKLLLCFPGYLIIYLDSLF